MFLAGKLSAVHHKTSWIFFLPNGDGFCLLPLPVCHVCIPGGGGDRGDRSTELGPSLQEDIVEAHPPALQHLGSVVPLPPATFHCSSHFHVKCLPQRLPHLFTLGSHIFSGLWVLLPGSPAFYFCLFASSFLAMSDFPSRGFLPSPSLLPLHGCLAHVHMTLCLAQRQASGLCCTFGVAAASVA